MDARETLTHAAHLDERLAARLTNLSPTEQRVARFFNEHREDVAFKSAAEMAQVLDTSDATVVRTARSLGYAGLPELKHEMIEEIRSRLTPAVRLGRSLEWIGDEPQAALDHMLTQQIEFLEEARRSVRPDEFQRAITLIDDAGRVLACGIGPLDPLAQYLALRLTRFGRQATAVTSTGFRLADELITMRRGDVLVLLVYGHLFREIEVTLTHAKQVGIPVVLITDTLAMAAQAEAALTAHCSRAGMLKTVAVALVLIEALLLGVAAIDRPRALAAMQQVNDLRAPLIGPQMDIDGNGTSPLTVRPATASTRRRNGKRGGDGIA